MHFSCFCFDFLDVFAVTPSASRSYEKQLLTYENSVMRARLIVVLYLLISSSSFLALVCFSGHASVVSEAFTRLFFDRCSS